MMSTRIKQRLSLPLQARFEDCIVYPRGIVFLLRFVRESVTRARVVPETTQIPRIYRSSRFTVFEVERRLRDGVEG